jgi:PilZ domain
MANNDGRFNIYEVTSLLFQIISYMSETERGKLQAVLMAKAGNGKDLSSLITSMSETNKCELLKRLTSWYLSRHSRLRGYSKHTELRGYPRKPFKIPVELSKNGFTFMCLTQNISDSGVFIHTDFSFHINQQITVILSPPKIEKDITVGGKIVRVDPRGIGVKFDELIPDFPYTFSQI